MKIRQEYFHLAELEMLRHAVRSPFVYFSPTTCSLHPDELCGLRTTCQSKADSIVQ